MKANWFSKLLILFLFIGFLTSNAVAAPSSQASAPAPDKIVVSKFGTSSISSAGGSVGENLLGPIATEIQKPKKLGSSPLRSLPGSGSAVPLSPGAGSPTSSGKKAKSNPEIVYSFEGLNHRDSRLSDNGNSFSGEPADQGLCVGNGYLMETVNSALRVYNASNGTPVSPVLSLYEFYGFPPAIVRTPTLSFGPSTFDISCHFDPGTNRWFHLAVDLDQDPASGAFTGKNYLDLAVSTSADPTGSWNVYRIPGMNDGSEGTPDHNCAGGPCFADFPHIGVDQNGVYITTNEFPLFASGFTGAQVYAISKQALVNGAETVDVYLFDTSQPAWQVREGEPGFTLWPALAAGNQFETDEGGSNYFVSSNAVFDDANGDSEEIIVWALSNTASLNSASPSLTLTRTIVPSQRYAVPANSVQKSGPFPLGECLNDRNHSIGPGINCGRFLLGLRPQNVTIGTIDTGDSRVLDARYANGKLWAVLGTAAEVSGQQRTGVGWFIFDASVSGGSVSASVSNQGILAVAGESLAYPTIGVTAAGRGAIGFTRVGENLHPSYGYASIDAIAGVGPVHMIREGQSTQDGFTEYPPVGGNRPRWGDYGAAAVDGNTVYLAGQYIEQPPCTLAQYISGGFNCFGYRTSLANWSTRVAKLTP